MTEAAPRPNDKHRITTPDDRLESWKEIAAYLNRGVRTVQRWERSEGLPIHRHRHDKRGTVYAYRHEIDVWRENRKEGAGPVAAGPNRGRLASVADWMSARLGRFIPSHLKKRLPVRVTTWILLVVV